MKSLRYLALVLVPLLLPACGDPPELVEKREKQLAEIARLRGELALVEEKIATIPEDRSKDLDAARLEAEGQASQLKDLEEQILHLEARKREIDDQFEAYRRKYVVR